MPRRRPPGFIGPPNSTDNLALRLQVNGLRHQLEKLRREHHDLRQILETVEGQLLAWWEKEPTLEDLVAFSLSIGKELSQLGIRPHRKGGGR